MNRKKTGRQVLLFTIFTTVLLSLVGGVARAQTDVQVVLGTPEVSAFPTISFPLDVHQAGGEFVRGLQPEQVTVLEDGQSLSVRRLDEIDQGVEWMVAVNAGPSLGIRDSEGVSRYERITEVLTNWANKEAPAETDTFSWFANGAASTTQLTSRAAWLAALQSYEIDFRNATPSLESLLAALDLASSPAPSEGMKPAILWITPPLEPATFDALPELIERAQQADASIYVWVVASAGAFNTDGALQLQQIAEQTGGQYLTFSGSEALADPDEYLDPLRGMYRLEYASAANQGGTHALAVRLTVEGSQWTSAEQTFELDIQAPNPMFMSPPSEVLRTCPANSKKPLEDLAPLSVPIRALIEFPDGHTRDLKAARYYVDGVLAAEITQAPFDRFDWDVSGYTADGAHTLRVEAEDILGMVKSSGETPVNVVIVIPPASIWTTITRNQTLLYILAVTGASLILGLVLFVAGRWKAHAAALTVLRQQHDPLSQVVPGSGVEPARIPDRQRRAPLPAAALVRLDGDNQPLPGAPIAFTGREMSFGRDPTRASMVIDAPSVDGLHARLRLTPDGSYMLSDQDSVAGTWINYAPISSEGARLEHGDLVHIGQVAFRFVLNKPPRARKPSVQPYREEP